MENSVKKTNEEKPAKRSVWLKILKWLGIFVGAILFVVLVIIANLGLIAEHIIEKYDMELVGRRIEAEDVSIRLFKSEAEIYDITLYEEDGETPFVAFNRLYAKIGLWELLDEVVHIKRVVAQFPYARIDQGAESFNFDSLIDYLVAKYSSDEPEDDSPSDWEIIIENIELSDGRLAYTDTTIEQHWSISELDIATE